MSGTPATTATCALGSLGLDRGGLLLVKRALRALPEGGLLRLTCDDPHFGHHLAPWCRAMGHALQWDGDVATLRPGPGVRGRWVGAEQSGGADPRDPAAVIDSPSPRWGLAGRSATVEAGSPPFEFTLAEKAELWADEAARLYAQAAAAQWDPLTAIDWQAVCALPDEVEDAVVQVMTYLIENETAALIVPARFVGRIHPHFREVMQLLTIQAADEARHIEVFTRRALLHRPALGLSTGGGQASLKTLLDEPDFALASFLLSVLGEGSFLVLLRFLRDHAPDAITRRVAELTALDEARHVAFGVAHLRRHAAADPTLRARLAQAIEHRHHALAHTAGLNEEVFDALLLLAAGSFEPDDLAEGHAKVVQMTADMDATRRGHLERLGFASDEAARLSSLHTRNFM